MSKRIAVNQSKRASAAEQPAVTPESTVEQLRALRAQIPNYGQLPVPEAQRLKTVSSLNADFTQAAIHAGRPFGCP